MLGFLVAACHPPSSVHGLRWRISFNRHISCPPPSPTTPSFLTSLPPLPVDSSPRVGLMSALDSIDLTPSEQFCSPCGGPTLLRHHVRRSDAPLLKKPQRDQVPVCRDSSAIQKIDMIKPPSFPSSVGHGGAWQGHNRVQRNRQRYFQIFSPFVITRSSHHSFNIVCSVGFTPTRSLQLEIGDKYWRMLHSNSN